MIPTFLQHAAQCWTECCYRQGGICPPSNFSVWGHGEDSSFAIQAVVWDCRSWSRSLRLSFQFHQCPPPLHRLSLPLLMLLWLLMALLQSYPSARNMPWPQNLETLQSLFLLFFFRMLKCMHICELSSIQSNSLPGCYLHWAWLHLHCPVLFECMSCPA